MVGDCAITHWRSSITLTITSIGDVKLPLSWLYFIARGNTLIFSSRTIPALSVRNFFAGYGPEDEKG
jgi:hypothetical protein